MGRHIYKNKSIEFVKTTVEIEKDLYDILDSIRCDYFDRRSFKQIINSALREYLKR